jgi:hypothetical protein
VASFHSEGMYPDERQSQITCRKCLETSGARCLKNSYGICERPAALLFGSELIREDHFSSVGENRSLSYIDISKS